MPVASPYRALGMSERGGGDPFPLRAVGDPAVVFAPRHLIGVGLLQMPADAVVNTELRTAQPGEIALCLIGACAIIGLELD